LHGYTVHGAAQFGPLGHNYKMKLSHAIVLFLLILHCAFSQEITGTLDPPKISDVVGFENSPIYVYSTDELKFAYPKEYILHYLTVGQVLPFDYDRQKLYNLAGYTPPKILTDYQKKWIEKSWKHQGKLTEVAGMYSVATGAITTKDDHIYFWWKLNDRVLWLAT
jgi:hypothetical protein